MQSLGTSSPQTALGRPSQARTVAEVQVEQRVPIESEGTNRGRGDPGASFFGTTSVPQGDSGEGLRTRRVSFGAPQEKEFDASGEQHNDLHNDDRADAAHDYEQHAYGQTMSPGIQDSGDDDQKNGSDGSDDDDTTVGLVEDATARLNEVRPACGWLICPGAVLTLRSRSSLQMHDARDEMHDQLEHIETTISLTDIEKPDTALPNLGMDANDDMADVLQVRQSSTATMLERSGADADTRADVHACERR